MTANALRILKYANTMEVYELTDAIKTLLRTNRISMIIWIFSSSGSEMF